MELFESILWVLFMFACVVVSGVILLQEGKGGGLGEAFGGAGQQSFGVKAAGINKFTGWASLAVVLLAVMITLVRADASVVLDGPSELPVIPGAAQGAPPTPPAGVPPTGTQQAPPPPPTPPADEPPADEPPADTQDGDGR